MKDFIKILRRFVPPYKKYLILNIIFNILAAFLTLFSFALVIPILEMLFQVKEVHYEYMAMGTASLKDVIVNNFYYYVQQTIVDLGQSNTLAILAVLLVLMTLLKTGVTYLSSYVIIPMRQGIVRDIRNYVYDKIVRLPISFFTSERKGDVMARMSGDVAEIERLYNGIDRHVLQKPNHDTGVPLHDADDIVAGSRCSYSSCSPSQAPLWAKWARNSNASRLKARTSGECSCQTSRKPSADCA